MPNSPLPLSWPLRLGVLWQRLLTHPAERQTHTENRGAKDRAGSVRPGWGAAEWAEGPGGGEPGGVGPPGLL